MERDLMEFIREVIQEEDYVNGHKVGCFKKDNCEYDIGLSYEDEYGEWWGVNVGEIKTIVTKEQFESVEYKVGGYNERR